MIGSDEPSGRRPALLAWSAALLAPVAAAALMVPARTHAVPSNLALIMVVVVAVSVVPGHRLAAVAAGLSAGVWFDFFLTRPYEQFSIHRSSDIQTTALLVAVGLVVGEIAARRRKARFQGRLAREEVIGLYVVAQMLSAGVAPRVVIDAVGEQLEALLSLASWRFERWPPGEGDPVINRAGELEYGAIAWSAARDGLPPRDLMLPVDHAGDTVARYVLRGPEIGVPVSADRLLVAVALSDLVGAALTGSRTDSDR
jgi:hypothetical protein